MINLAGSKRLRIYLLPLLMLTVLLAACGSRKKKQDTSGSRPNIIIILADDMGYGDVAAFNQFAKIPTPNIDRLAREGMRFTDAHAPGAVCHPSRYGLLTGRYPFRTNVNVWPEQPVIDEGRMTIASLLQEKGYRTSMVGKWHLGFDESEAVRATAAAAGATAAGKNKVAGRNNNARAAYRVYRDGQVLPGGPVDRGFDSFFGIRASTDIPPYFYIRDNRVLASPADSIDAGQSEDGWTDIQGAFWRAGGIAPGLDLAAVLPRFAEEAVQVIEDHASRRPEQPLLLYVAFPSPHTPWLPAEDFRGISGAGDYGDFVAMVDAKVGELLTALQEADMAKESLVIFSSDNGPVWYPGDTLRFGHHSNAGIRLRNDAVTEQVSFRGMKGDAYEGGHHMPFIVRWPGVVEEGSISGQTVSFTDLMATFADIVDLELPAGAGEDSFSLLPVLKGEQPETEAIRPPVITVSARGVKSIQDGRWKLIEALGSGGFTAPAHRKPTPNGPQGQLYDLINDPGESNNLWSEHPEIVERLKDLLKKWEQRGTRQP